VVWRDQEEGEWESERYHLGEETDVFNMECYAISEGVRMAAVSSEYKEVTKVTIFSTPPQ
jgi:hypothetical protein